MSPGYEKIQERNSGPEEKKVFFTSSGIQINRLYQPKEMNEEYTEKLGFPGEYPYTRGVHSTMYRGRLWTMRQYSGFGTAKETNKRFKFLLERGQKGLSCAFDLPTQTGYDSDAAIAAGEVGKVGVAIDSLQDMEELLSGIPLDQVSTSMTINAPAAVILAMYIVVAEKQGVPLASLTGTVQNDILKEYVARGTYIFPPRASMRLTADIIAYCTNYMPKFRAISVSGYHMREAGANAVQELAFVMANAIAYVRAALHAGLMVDEFAPRFSFFFNVHNHFFEEVAKFRAARRLWSGIMREQFGARNPKSWQFHVHAQTAGSTLTAKQPDNNVTRVALQALAAVLGGSQSLHTNAKDEALALPTETSVHTALRTQQIIAYESGVTDTVDPLAGSYFVEHLTDEIERKAGEYISKIERMGGALAAVESNYMLEEIQRESYHFQRRVESGEITVVGYNRFTEGATYHTDLHDPDTHTEQKQRLRLKRLRQNRDNAAVKKALTRLKSAAAGDRHPLMSPIIAAVKSYATVEEICNVLRDVFGEYVPN